jgi:two-component system, LytTR family, sensor kinase
MPHSNFELFKPVPSNALVLFLVIMMISAGVRIVQEWMQAEKKARQTEAERIAVELSFLRSQINPHFLFNTLNSIYSLALMKSDTTADAVMKLSDMMRYMTEDTGSDFVPLSREVEYLRHYTELQRIRLAENNRIGLDITGQTGDYVIPPLILMPFVENTFKYGVSTHEPATVSISLEIADDTLRFHVMNLIVREASPTGATGLGIRNTRERLQRIYPGKHSLTIKDTQGFFSVDLIIRLR